jgi:hypothetical protein
MTAPKYVSLASCLVLITATMASAQQGPVGPAAPLDRGYMTGGAGATFSDSRAASFGIEIGERLNARVQAYVAFHYFENLFNDQAAGNLSDLADTLTRTTGDLWEFQGRDRGLAFGGGAKYLLSRGPSVRPYVGGGPGVINIRRTITERTLGDVSDPVLVVFGAPDGFINAQDVSTFRPMAEFIAGVGIASGRTYVDVGYRLRKIFRVDSFTFSQFTVGVGMKF